MTGRTSSSPLARPLAAGIVAALLMVGAWLVSRKSEPISAPTQAEIHALAERTEADRRAAEVAGCVERIGGQIAEYQERMKAGDYWGASLSIRYCTGYLDRDDLRRMLATAEKQSYLKEVNDPKVAAGTKIRAINQLLAHFPEEGGKYRSRLPRLQSIAEKEYQREEAKRAESERRRKKRQGVMIGMTQDDAIASSWGKPRKVNRTITARGVREQWVYDGGYLYFDDGILTAIQN